VYRVGGRVPDITIPDHVMPADNALDYFQDAFQLSLSTKHNNPHDMAGARSTTNTLANFRAFAIEAAPALKIMREGLNHPFMSPAQRSVSSAQPKFYASLIDLDRTDVAAAHYYAVSDDPGRAMEMRLDGLEMGVMMQRGSGLVGADLGLSCEAIADSGIEPLIPRLTAGDLKRAASRMNEIARKSVPYSDIMLEEGNIQAALSIEMLRDRKDEYVQSIPFSFVNKRALLRKNLDWYAAMAAEARVPFSGQSRVPVPSNYFAELAGPAPLTARAHFVAMDAVFSIIRVEIALYQYKIQNGKFPTTLAQLCPDYFPFVPLDPCDPRPAPPLRYAVKNSGNSFLLYSIGPDRIDNGGKPAKDVGWWTPGDMVAGKLFTNGPVLFSGAEKSSKQ
jgi:hypothetical protein